MGPFDIDWSRYKLVDLSQPIRAGDDGPELAEDRGPDGTFRHIWRRLPAQTGTHVLLPRHFHADGRSLGDLPLTAFMGRAVLADVRPADGRVTEAELDQAAGQSAQRDDILVVRRPRDGPPAVFSVGAAHWMLGRGVKMLITASMGFGATVAEKREFQDILLGRDMPIIPAAHNLDRIPAARFFVIAWPPLFVGLESVWVRVGAVVER